MHAHHTEADVRKVVATANLEFERGPEHHSCLRFSLDQANGSADTPSAGFEIVAPYTMVLEFDDATQKRRRTSGDVWVMDLVR